MREDYIEENELVTPAMEKRWVERKALLRVARAAKHYRARGYEKPCESWLEELDEALDAVEHLP